MNLRKNQYTLDNILFENVMELSRYILGKAKRLDFKTLDIEISRNDNIVIRSKIMSIDLGRRKQSKINKSALWYDQKKIKEGKSIRMHNKTREGIE
jgi:CRISPR-associated protein Cas1